MGLQIAIVHRPEVYTIEHPVITVKLLHCRIDRLTLQLPALVGGIAYPFECGVKHIHSSILTAPVRFYLLEKGSAQPLSVQVVDMPPVQALQ